MTDETVASIDAQQSVGDSGLRAGIQLDRYTLLRELGTGGMGVVWAAHDPDLDRDVALKFLHGIEAGPAARVRFLREARAMARLKHPNVLTVYEVGTHAGRDYIAMELVDGMNLDAWLRGKPSRADIWSALLAAGRGLAAAHEAGLVHRDFKPQNVLVRRDGRVLVTDFGLVRTFGDEAPEPVGPGVIDRPVSADDATLQAPRGRPSDPALAAKLTHTGSVMGTPAYMAPEQFAGTVSDPRSDQFAFCITVWQALTGRRPYDGVSLDDFERAANAGVETVASELAAPVRGVLVRGLAPQAADRFATMAALLDALDHARRAPRRRRIAFAIAGGLLAVLALVIVVWKLRAAPWYPEIQSIEPSFDENSDAPAISPDGKTILYPGSRGFDGAWMIYMVSIDGGEPRIFERENCGWSVRWTRDGSAVVMVCGEGTERRVVRRPIAGGPLVELGPALAAEPCGDKLLVSVSAATHAYLAFRGSDGRDTEIASGEITRIRCDRDGEHIAYIRNAATGYADIELWVIDHGDRRLVLRGGIVDMAFTPGAGSLVIARAIAGSFDLVELVLADGSLHRVTTNAYARAVDVSRDDIVVFDHDVSTGALFEHVAGRKTQKTYLIEALHHPTFVSSDRVVVEREDETTVSVVLVDLADGGERVLAQGRAPFVSRDGKRILFVAADDPKRLDAVAIEGGPATVVARLPAPIIDGVDASDGIHLEIGDRPHSFEARYDKTRAWVVDDSGALHDELVDGLVFPMRSGWRAVRQRREHDDVLRFAAPGRPLTELAGDRVIYGRPAWLAEHEIGLCDATSCARVDVATATTLETTPINFDRRRPPTVAPDGKRWFTTQTVGHVTRHKIVNFADRPWRP